MVTFVSIRHSQFLFADNLQYVLVDLVKWPIGVDSFDDDGGVSDSNKFYEMLVGFVQLYEVREGNGRVSFLLTRLYSTKQYVWVTGEVYYNFGFPLDLAEG